MKSDLTGSSLLESPAKADMLNGQRQVSATELEENVFGTVDKSSPKLSLHVYNPLHHTIQQTLTDTDSDQPYLTPASWLAYLWARTSGSRGWQRHG